MPKQTFLNLPEEKRNRIMDCAINEFAEYGYDKASISRIVASAGIAKGSFYQYFDDKEDLYAMLLEQILIGRKLRVSADMEPALREMNLTEFLRVLFLQMVDAFEHDTKAVQISLDFLRHQNGPVQKRIAAKYLHIRDNYYQNFIRQEQSRGEIDPNVDADFLAAMLLGVSYLISAHIEKYGLDENFRDYLETGVDRIEYILTNGIYGS